MRVGIPWQVSSLCKGMRGVSFGLFFCVTVSSAWLMNLIASEWQIFAVFIVIFYESVAV